MARRQLGTAASANAHLLTRADADARYTGFGLLDAKGDLIVATANDTAARLAVGANGSMPIADSSASTGIAWASLSWTNVSFQNSWVDFDAANWQRVQYRKIGDLVMGRGCAKSGTIGGAGVIYTLPTGFRPPVGIAVPANSNAAFAHLVINTAGEVIAVTGSNVIYWVNFIFSITS